MSLLVIMSRLGSSRELFCRALTEPHYGEANPYLAGSAL